VDIIRGVILEGTLHGEDSDLDTDRDVHISIVHTNHHLAGVHLRTVYTHSTVYTQYRYSTVQCVYSTGELISSCVLDDDRKREDRVYDASTEKDVTLSTEKNVDFCCNPNQLMLWLNVLTEKDQTMLTA